MDNFCLVKDVLTVQMIVLHVMIQISVHHVIKGNC